MMKEVNRTKAHGDSLAKLAQGEVANIDGKVRPFMESESVPGMVVGIFNHGETLLAKGYGLADVARGVPVNPNMAFQIGSIGKSFVSAAIMMLVENNELSLDDSIYNYFRDAPESWRNIKIKHLLSHTSGLKEYLDRPSDLDSPMTLRATLDYTENEIASVVESFPVEFGPGQKYSYTNTNYMLLGIIIHRITGMHYFDFLEERIFKPLGMDSVRQGLLKTRPRDGPRGYELKEGNVKPIGHISDTFNSTADGTLYCNVFDLAKWDAALYGERLLKRSSLNDIFTVFKLNNGEPNEGGYGFGWFIKEANSRRIIEHTGNWGGFTSVMSRYVDDGFSVIIMCNLDFDTSDKIAGLAHSISGLIKR